jgi:hypothetical protein
MARKPAEILEVLDEAQRYLDSMVPEGFDMRSLLWDALNDVLDSVALAEQSGDGYIHDTVADYVGTYYGDE